MCSLEYRRQGLSLVVKVSTVSGPAVRLASAVKGSRVGSDGASVVFALPVVEVAVPHGLPLPGARTAQMKVLGESSGARSLKLDLEAEGGAVVTLKVRRNGDKVNLRADGGTILSATGGHDGGGFEDLVVKFPEGTGYQGQVVTLRW